ncbi:Hypothetical protein,predicted lipoprotein, DUF285 familly [Metamycoplasma auris 15026]|uniref:Lipoprotein n=1 Tax=Metamycoplasma auris 15026 TaxID=1188233 RepID=N9TSS6_9BACT|nr:BspA family leucine-rich repeat surface protein [Metamycoplasma auris]ENY69135.1 Hypothetical protein,predicted lipoprotein, DUF285 familly [Metamycoplasma auris 15026]
MSTNPKNTINKLLLFSLIPLTSFLPLLAISCKKEKSISQSSLIKNKLLVQKASLINLWDASADEIKLNDKYAASYKKLRSAIDIALRSNDTSKLTATLNEVEDFIKEVFGDPNSKNKIDIVELLDAIKLYWDSYERFVQLMQYKYIAEAYTKTKEKYEKEVLTYQGKKYNIYFDAPALVNILKKKDIATFAQSLKEITDKFENELKDIVNDSIYNNAPTLDERIWRKPRPSFINEVLPALERLIKDTWDKETLSKIKSGQTYGNVLSMLKEDVAKNYHNLPQVILDDNLFINDSYLKEKLFLKNGNESDILNKEPSKTFDVEILSHPINLRFFKENLSAKEVIKYLWYEKVVPEITTYHSELVISNKLKRTIKEYEERFPILKNAKLRYDNKPSPTKYSYIKPSRDNFINDWGYVPRINRRPHSLESIIKVSIDNEDIELGYYAKKEANTKPTRFKAKNGIIYTTLAKDLNNIDIGYENIEEILEIGYYKDETTGLIRAPRMPKHIDKVPKQLPEVVTSIKEIFKGNNSFKIEGIEKWDTSSINNMESVFEDAPNFNQDISGWDVSQVENMSGMFSQAHYFNQPLNDWDVSNVKNMNYMFNEATSFNQPLDKWDTWQVETMENMFYKATSFNQDISQWDIACVHIMKNWSIAENPVLSIIKRYTPTLFYDKSKLTFSTIPRFPTNHFFVTFGKSYVPTTYKLRNGKIKKTYHIHLPNLAFHTDIEEIIEIGYYKENDLFTMVKMPYNINKVPKSLPSKITSLKNAFSAVDTNHIIGLDEWNTSNIVNMSHTFRGSKINQNLNSWNVEKVTDMSFMFKEATSFNQPLYKWKPKSLQDMTMMFYGAKSFNQDLSDWKVKNVKSKSRFFWYTNNWQSSRWPNFSEIYKEIN